MAKVAVATDVDEEVEVKPEVRADDGLAKLVSHWKQADQLVNNTLVKKESYFVQIVDYIKANKLSRNVVRKTLESKGLAEGSLNSTLSRIFNLAKSENAPILEKLREGEFTQAQVRIAIAKPQEHPAKSVLEIIQDRLLSAAKVAFTEPTIVDGVAAFRDLASAAWDEAKRIKQEKEAKKAAANVVGNGEGEEDSGESPAVDQSE